MTGQTRRHRLTGILGLCGPLAAAMFVFADLAGISMTPGYSPITQAISELMERDAPAKLIVDPLLVAYHGLVIPFAAGLHRGLPRGVPELAGPLLIGLAGVAGVILTLFFPCDPGCTPFTSLRGTLHIFIAIPMGFAILIGILLAGRRLRGHPALARYAYVTAGFGLALAGFTVGLAETDVVGLVERALTWSYLQWYAVSGLLIWHWAR